MPTTLRTEVTYFIPSQQSNEAVSEMLVRQARRGALHYAYLYTGGSGGAGGRQAQPGQGRVVTMHLSCKFPSGVSGQQDGIGTWARPGLSSATLLTCVGLLKTTQCGTALLGAVLCCSVLLDAVQCCSVLLSAVLCCSGLVNAVQCW